MRIRTARPEIKYIEDEGTFQVNNQQVGNILMLPAVLDRSVNNGGVIGNKIKLRYFKVRIFIIPGGDPDTGTTVIPIRISIVQRRIADETQWNNYIDELHTNNTFWNGNYARVLYEKEKYLVNNYDPNVRGGDGFIYQMDKTFKVPMNIVINNLGIRTDLTKSIYVYIANRVVATEINDLRVEYKVRTSYIDN